MMSLPPDAAYQWGLWKRTGSKTPFTFQAANATSLSISYSLLYSLSLRKGNFFESHKVAVYVGRPLELVLYIFETLSEAHLDPAPCTLNIIQMTLSRIDRFDLLTICFFFKQE